MLERIGELVGKDNSRKIVGDVSKKTLSLKNIPEDALKYYFESERVSAHEQCVTLNFVSALIESDTKVFAFSTKKGRVTQKEAVFLLPQIDGLGVNALLYAASPIKRHGFLTSDIRGDWKTLYGRDKGKNGRRLRSHQAIPNWADFEIEREMLLKTIIDTYQEAFTILFMQQGFTISVGERKGKFQVTPAIHLIRGEEGLRIGTNKKDREILEKGDFGEKSPLSPLCGLYLTAALSQNIVSTMSHYKGHGKNMNKGFQDMAPTQVAAYALAEKERFEKSPLVSELAKSVGL